MKTYASAVTSNAPENADGNPKKTYASVAAARPYSAEFIAKGNIICPESLSSENTESATGTTTPQRESIGSAPTSATPYMNQSASNIIAEHENGRENAIESKHLRRWGFRFHYLII